MIVLVLSGEENTFGSIPGTTPALCYLQIMELYTLLLHCLGHPSLFSAPCTKSPTFLTIAGLTLPHTPIWPHARQTLALHLLPLCDLHLGCWGFVACGLASWLSKCTTVLERDSGAGGHPQHRTYRALRFPCPWPGSPLPCPLVAMLLFIRVSAAE